MPLFEVAGWDRRSAQRVVWYLDAMSQAVASAYASDAGVNEVAARAVERAPQGAPVIRVEDAVLLAQPAPRRRFPILPFWLGALAGAIGALVMLVILGVFRP